MDVVVRYGEPGARPAGILAVGIPQGERALADAAAAVDRAARGAIERLLRSGDFTGRALETALLYPTTLRARRLLLIGMGPMDDLGPQRVRDIAGVAARRARELGAGTLALAVPGAERRANTEHVATAAAEGAVLGHYRFFAYRTESVPAPLRRVELIVPAVARSTDVAAAAERGRQWAEATCLSRDLAWIPGQDLTPERLADRAREIGKGAGARVQVLGPRELERLGMGAVLAVGRGSVNPPRFVALEYGAIDAGDDRRTRASSARARGRGRSAGGRTEARRPLVVIGKGVTFDTGGISLKPRENMHKMKYDMSGAAAVIGLFSALPMLAPPFPVVGLIPTAENMPDGAAFKPGDVIRAMDGTTIEVTNTDAEGRLLLADALVYARRYRPAAVVDLATLTGAISIALGPYAAGLFSPEEGLADELLAAAAQTGERLWRMPLWSEFRNDLRSDTADLVNSSGGRDGGAIIAAVFLRHFARGLPWAHLDIASTGWSPTDRPCEPRGPTGFGVRLLLEWISRRSAASSARS
jgi:leucyl aminopeptidase